MRIWRSIQFKILIALIMGGIASFSAWSYLNGAREKIEISQDDVPVLRANRYVKPGQVLTEKMVSVADIPRAYVEPTAIQMKKDLFTSEGKPLYKVRHGLQKGEQVTRSKLLDDRIFLGLSWILEPNQIAWSVLLGPENAVGGWVRPGDRVQLLATLPKQDGWAKTKTVVLLDNVPVLAVQDDAWKPISGPEEFDVSKSMASEPILVTIGCTSKEAAMASLANERGTLQLTLLSSLRTKASRPISVSMAHLKRGK